MTRALEWSNYPANFREQVSLLQKLFRYIRHTPCFNPGDTSVELEPTGRFHDPRAYVLYWPHLLSSARVVNRLVELVFRDERALLRRAKSHGFSLSDLPERGVPRNRWQLTQVRSALESAAGALLLPPESTEAIERAHTYAYAMPVELRDEKRVGASDVGALMDLRNYTVIRRVADTDEALLRTILAPPAWPTIKDYFSSLPEPLRWLYHAWRVLASRNHTPYDPAQVGIEFTRQGYIFVNWVRFANSSFSPSPTGDIENLLAPDQIAENLYELRVPRRRTVNNKPKIVLHKCTLTSVRNCIPYPVDLREVRYGSSQGANFYLKQCRSLGYGTFDDTKNPDRCTIVDPLKLAERSQLFQGYKYYQAEHAAAAQRAAYVYRQSIGAAPKAFPRVYEFAFKPSNYADEIREHLRTKDYPLWFGDEVEPIYAVKRKDQLTFTNPTRLKSSSLECGGDWAVWSRMMDALGFIQGLSEDGSLAEVQQRCRSDWWRKLHRVKLTQMASAMIKDFSSYDDLSKRKRDEVSHRLNKLYLEGPHDGDAGGTWFSNEQAKLVQRLIPPAALRRVLTVLLPGQEVPKEKIFFYTTHAVKIFQRAALSSFGRAPTDLADPITQMLYVFVTPAPYIYAWTRFCLDMQRQGVDFAVTYTASASVREKFQERKERREARQHGDIEAARENGKRNVERWTPQEDYLLLRKYRKFPHLNATERRDLLDALPLRAQADISKRVRQFEMVFRRYLTEGRRRECSLFEHSLSDAAAKRVIILMGCHLAASPLGHRLHKRHGVVSDIFRLTDDALIPVELPPKYSSQFYVKYFDPNVV